MADHLALTLSASPDCVMDGQSRPTRMTLGFAQTPNLAALENMNPAFPQSRNVAGSYGSISNLELWYQRNDGPWTPPGLAPPRGDLRNPSNLGNLRANHQAFPQGYRESIAPSDCDTIAPGVVPSDSGYGGSYGAKHSIANGSVCDESLDRSQETQSIAGHMSELNFQPYNQDMIHKSGLNTEASWPQSQQSPPSLSVINPQVNLDGRMCEICQRVLKTKSEFKKHKQRHDKPFRCNVKNCTRSEGFSTPNDLDRHIRSLHPEEHASGNRYRCLIGACKTKDKIWPRADNFRAHMKRVHRKDQLSDNDLDQYKFSPTNSPNDVSDITRETEARSSSDKFMFSVAPDNCTLPRHPVIDLSAETNPTDEPNQVQMEETPQVNESSDEIYLHASQNVPAQEIHSEGDDLSIDQQIEIPEPSSVQPCSTLTDETEFAKPDPVKDDDSSLDCRKLDSKIDRHPSPLDGDKEDEVKESQEYPSGSPLENSRPNRQPGDLVEADEDSNARPSPRDLDEYARLGVTSEKLRKFLEELEKKGLLGHFGFFKKDETSEEEVAKQEPVRCNASELPYACSSCEKRFGRRCELKKHEKRHFKPYGCTFPDCKKKFGSKNDWKRHENSQHYMAEHWRCNEKRNSESAETCGKVLSRRELFRQHLIGCHQIKDATTLETKIEKCRVGRNSEVRFWCGFCREIIEVKKDGIEAWTERFNHIDDHFHGRNNQVRKEISAWQEEYSPDNGAEATTHNPEDSRATSSTPATSTNTPDTSDTPSHRGSEKRQVRTTKQKRKRDDECADSAKRHELEEVLRYHCVCGPLFPTVLFLTPLQCECREMMPMTSKQCTNYPCDHKLCMNCW
ncbi:hypothetical protein F5B19DRAFT_167385 [Rostrohypoxylon terebratum]|nr:hypothetical protein F5B19DRAFT_167385 [Rostrohypoxylon terebratum]